jgi:adenylate kinase family enzyme
MVARESDHIEKYASQCDHRCAMQEVNKKRKRLAREERKAGVVQNRMPRYKKPTAKKEEYCKKKESALACA